MTGVFCISWVNSIGAFGSLIFFSFDLMPTFRRDMLRLTSSGIPNKACQTRNLIMESHTLFGPPFFELTDRSLESAFSLIPLLFSPCSFHNMRTVASSISSKIPGSGSLPLQTSHESPVGSWGLKSTFGTLMLRLLPTFIFCFLMTWGDIHP